MPPPKKLDLIPEEFRRWLAEELKAEGFAKIVEVTERLNFRLQEGGLEITVGKTAVGEYSKLLKDQREAYAMSEALLADMDVEAESEMHKVLTHLLSTMTFQLLQRVREADEVLEPKQLMEIGRMLQSVMSSTGMREKIREEERRRIAARAKAEAAEELEASSGELGLSADTVEAIKKKVLGV